jgi:steroid delta-isomerase-like uncharacterized protein
MSLEQNKAIVHQFYKAYNQGNLEQAKEIVAPNIIIHTWGATICDCNDVIEYIQMVRSTFSDSYYTIADVIAEDDKVVSRGTFTGTHCKEFLGIPPTGKQVNYSIVEIDRLADGKIVEHRTIGDSLTMLQQLRGENLV